MTDPGLVESRVGGPALLTLQVGATTLTEGIGAVTINHGRRDTGEQPSPATCTVQIESSSLAALPVIGQQLVITLGSDAVAHFGLVEPDLTAALHRFSGDITDIQLTPQPNLPGRPSIVTLVAVSRRARLGRLNIGDAAWPAELDGARAARLLGLAAATAGVTVGTVDAGTVTVLARDPDPQPALGLLDELAADAAALLVELRDGSVEWHDTLHRTDGTTGVELTAANLLTATSATMRQAGLVNSLTIAYGPDTPQATVTVTDDASQALYGPASASLTTRLVALADAQARADLAVGRRSTPRWQLDTVALDLLRTVDVDLAAQLLQLEVGDLVSVAGLPPALGTERARLWVEGWTETVSRHSWQLVLSVSYYALTSAGTRWVDLPVDPWSSLDADLTWRNSAGHDFGAADLGRWLDEPGANDWAGTDPAPTWATV